MIVFCFLTKAAIYLNTLHIVEDTIYYWYVNLQRFYVYLIFISQKSQYKDVYRRTIEILHCAHILKTNCCLKAHNAHINIAKFRIISSVVPQLNPLHDFFLNLTIWLFLAAMYEL